MLLLDIFEFELEVLKDVWKATWDLQAYSRSLRPSIDNLPEDKEKELERKRRRYKYLADEFTQEMKQAQLEVRKKLAKELEKVVEKIDAQP